MKSLRKSQALAIMAAGNSIGWRKSQSNMSTSTTDGLGTASLRELFASCSPCFGASDSDEDYEAAQGSHGSHAQQQQQQQLGSLPSANSKLHISASKSSSSLGSSKYSTSAAPSLPPLECETVHITFRRDIMLASPSSWKSGHPAATWASDLIPTPPARSSSRTSMSYPLIRNGIGQPYQLFPASASSSTLNSTFERTSVVPTAIKHAFSHDLGRSDTFSPIQMRARTLHEQKDYKEVLQTCDKPLASLRSSTQLQDCIAMNLPSMPQPAFLQKRAVFKSAGPYSPSLKDADTLAPSARGLWPLASASAISSTETLVCLDHKPQPYGKASLEKLKAEPALPIIFEPDNRERTMMTPPPAFTRSFLNVGAEYSPSYTIEAVSAPGSPAQSLRALPNPRPLLNVERSPLTPATFDTFGTSGTPLMDRFPRVQDVEGLAGAPRQTTMNWDASFRLINMCTSTDTDDAERMRLPQPNPAFLSPHWTSPAQRERGHSESGDEQSGDSQLSTPRCRKGLIHTALSPSTAWLLRTAIQASDDGEADASENPSGAEAGRATAGRNTYSTDLNNFKMALGRLQAAVSVPLTRYSIDGGAVSSSEDTNSDTGYSSASEYDASPSLRGPSGSPTRSAKVDPALCDLLRELGMQPLTPPLHPSSQFDAAQEVAANWAARCRRSLCKAAHNSGLSPGSLLNFSAPESPDQQDVEMDHKAGDGAAAPQKDGQSKRRVSRAAVPGLQTVTEEEIDSPAPSFNFSICQQTPTLDDFPYTLAMLASLRKCRDSNAFRSSVAPASNGCHSKVDATAASAQPESAEVFPTVGLGLGGADFGNSMTVSKSGMPAVVGGADSIFELYGCPPTPRLRHASTTLRRSASDASVSTVRSTHAAASTARLARRSSMQSTPTTPKVSAYPSDGWNGLWGTGASEPPRCPPPSCPLPPLPDLPSRFSLLVQRPTRTLI